MARAWIGKSIVIIGAIHTAFGFLVFRSTLIEVFKDGLVNTVNGQPAREFVFWFVAFGFLAIILGLLVDRSERESAKLPKFLGWSLLALTLVMVTIMPVSGAWLVLAPAVGAIARSR